MERNHSPCPKGRQLIEEERGENQDENKAMKIMHLYSNYFFKYEKKEKVDQLNDISNNKR